ncbi:histidine phosphatase family protein [Aerophototrophica crusticola]|uniref:Histidine phosphatase family protein n=1 Tax=Aerophototrophica crusticola TaxID=1709002 RepID=A0A858R6T6_9PROT|nr:histidine phosphatase family protein [Rhodospirillaceae bacterium B3]
MRTLTLLRHAKSDWGNPALPDHDRPLNARGLRAAATMADYLGGGKGAAGRPDLILCSTARRAVDTLAPLLGTWEDPPTVRYERDLYLCGPSALLLRLRQVPAQVGHVMVVAHNPDLHELSHGLAGSGDEALRRSLARKLPTGSYVRIEVPTDDWASLDWSRGRLAAFVPPRSLGEEAGT